MEGTGTLNVQALSKRFDQNSAIEDITFTIHQGEKIALIGPSGAGKSTLFNLLTRTLEPNSGTIEINGQESHNIKDAKAFGKLIGIMRQQFDLVPNLNVLNNTLIGRFNEWGTFKSILSLFKPQDFDTAKHALESVGLGDKIYKPTTTLSGGELQRLAIARLFVQNPSILLANEPVSSLDPVNAHHVLSLLTTLAGEHHKTVIASIHSVDLAKTYFDRLIGLKQGRLVFDLATEEVTEQDFKELYRMDDYGTT